MFVILRGFYVFIVFEFTFVLVCVVEVVLNDGKDKENIGNSNGGNNSYE